MARNITAGRRTLTGALALTAALGFALGAYSNGQANAAPEPSPHAVAEADPGLALVQEYTGLLTDGDAEAAHALLSQESTAYFETPESLLDSPGMPEMIEDIAGSEGAQWTWREAYPETHRSERAITIWGENADGLPFAYAWAARTTDDGQWVIDQDRFASQTGLGRVLWLNPGASLDDPHLADPHLPIWFGLSRYVGVENVAVNASIDDGDMFIGDTLLEMPGEGYVQYELIDFDVPGLTKSEPHALTVAFVAEDAPFVHVQATGFEVQTQFGPHD